MVKLASVLSRLNPAKIMVVGDMLLDTYTMGKARRISPEAPVAIVNVQREEHRPGGAGNVILNLLSLGAEVVAIGRCGNDWAGQTMVAALKSEGVQTEMILKQEAYRTPVKNRIIADNQQIVRVDHEQVVPISSALEREIIASLPALLEGVQVVALSDYGKGFLSKHLIAELISHSKAAGIPVITDPKGHDFTIYKGTTIIKPNLGEAFAAAGLPPTAPLELAAARVLEQAEAQLLMVTRSEAGISLFDDAGQRFDFPVHAKEVKDVTGAGDTVLAMLAHAVANQLTYQEAAQLCNVAGGIAIEHVGCARVTLSDLAHRLFQRDMSNKVFDQDHLFVLQQILRNKLYHLLVLSQMDQLTPELFQVIKQLSDLEALVVYIKDEPQDAFIEMLASLREISFIVIHLDSIKSLCQCAGPQGTYVYDPLKSQLKPIDWEAYLTQCQVSEEAAALVR